MLLGGQMTEYHMNAILPIGLYTAFQSCLLFGRNHTLHR